MGAYQDGAGAAGAGTAYIYAPPTAAMLSLAVMCTNQAVVVSWPLPAEGWVLEWTNALPQVSSSWSQIPPPYQTNGANLQFTEPQPAGNKFYRLHKPSP